MIIGSMDRLVTIQRRTETQDTTGQPVSTWSWYATVYAQKIERAGTERNENEQLVATRDDELRTYYIDGMNAKDFRIIADGQLYDILSVVEWGRRQWHVLKIKVSDNEVAP